MLHADKELLQAETAREILTVREKELNYYTTSLNTISTLSTLLAGFAITFLSSQE